MAFVGDQLAPELALPTENAPGLLGTQLISRLRKEFRVELALRQLLDTPTVADLGVAIVQLQADQADRDGLAQLLEELEDLSDESVERELADPEASDG